MADMGDWINVLNGKAYVGDRLAVAVGNARYGSGMRVGTILEIEPGRVKLQVDQSSGYHSQDLPYIKTFDKPRAMVRL
jgi:hypothetical protein